MNARLADKNGGDQATRHNKAANLMKILRGPTVSIIVPNTSENPIAPVGNAPMPAVRRATPDRQVPGL